VFVMADEMVVLVDEEDREVGTGEKVAVHRAGKLHRAFSVFVVDAAGRVLLQRRAPGKYHSPGLWSNTCCGHPRPGESVAAGAHRRLREEMGFDGPLSYAFRFVYRAELGDLTEHELDHVFVGSFAGHAAPDPTEVVEWRTAPVPALQADLAAHPSAYTIWLRPALEGLLVRGLLPTKG